MVSNTSKSLASLLKTSSQLQPLLSQVQMLRQATSVLRDKLPGPMRDHCQVVNISELSITIVTDTSAWAAKLRYMTPTLLEKLARDLKMPTLLSLCVRVLPVHIDATPSRSPARRMPEEVGCLLASTAATVTDPKLQAALQRLSRHGQ